MTSSDFGYKFLDRALQQYPLTVDAPVGPELPIPRGYALPIGPQQRVVDQLGLLEGSQPYSQQFDFARSQVLPQIVDALGVEGTRQAVFTQDRNRVAEENLAAQRVRRQRELERFEARTNGRRMIDELSPLRDEYLGTSYNDGVQRPITGLNQAISEGRRAAEEIKGDELVRGYTQLTSDYPELRPLLMDTTQNVGTGRARRARGEAFAPYLQYTDLEQQYSDPFDRQLIYEALSKQPNADEYNFASLESDYTSGDPVRQQQARETLIRAGVQPEMLTNIERSAFQERRPVVGGGGYVDAVTDPDALYINQRAEATNRLADELMRVPGQYSRLEQAFPGLTNLRPGVRETRRFGIDVNDGQLEIDPTYDEVDTDWDSGDLTGGDVYEATVNKGSSGQRLLGLDDLGEQPISKNVLRFLRDNPAFRQSSISFQTATPTESLSFDAKELPRPVAQAVGSFVMDEVLSNNRQGTLLENSPMSSSDLIESAEESGGKSSTLRKVTPFLDAGTTPPNLRGLTYSAAGFGPNSRTGGQYTFVDGEGNLIPLQPFRPERALVGSVRDYGSSPAVPYSATPRFYASILPGLTLDGLRFAFDRIKAVPSSLLPSAADLIPSSEAVSQTYNYGPLAGGRQVVKDFLGGVPVSLGLVPVLSSPAVAPLAPGIGAGLVGTAGTEAVNELVKQETGKGLGQRIQETAGAVSGDTSLVGTGNRGSQRDSNQGRERARREMARVETPATIQAATIQPDNTGINRAGENFLQRRLRLAQEARAQDPGDFGITELLFGR